MRSLRLRFKTAPSRFSLSETGQIYRQPGTKPRGIRVAPLSGNAWRALGRFSFPWGQCTRPAEIESGPHDGKITTPCSCWSVSPVWNGPSALNGNYYTPTTVFFTEFGISRLTLPTLLLCTRNQEMCSENVYGTLPS
jgi:hypothetical protein